MPLVDENDLLKKAAMRRKLKQEQKSSLPLPEVTQDADVVTKEKQRMAKLAVSGLAEAVSNALSSEA